MNNGCIDFGWSVLAQFLTVLAKKKTVRCSHIGKDKRCGRIDALVVVLLLYIATDGDR